ncbi:MAG: hypothetical protein JRJ69_09190 [Deltaproteobacteria bacterium]|nr:hypothetical protein [Deltaproteobacteria bacterium]
MKTFIKIFLYNKKAFLAFSLLACVVFATCYVTITAAASVTDGARRFTLENGFTVILKENHTSPVVSIQGCVHPGVGQNRKRQ